VSGSGINWAICKSAPRPRQIITPESHNLVFTGWMPSCHPTKSIKALGNCQNNCQSQTNTNFAWTTVDFAKPPSASRKNSSKLLLKQLSKSTFSALYIFYSMLLHWCFVIVHRVSFLKIGLKHFTIISAFRALMLLVGQQEGRLACKNWVVRYWSGYLSGAGLPRLSWKKGH